MRKITKQELRHLQRAFYLPNLPMSSWMDLSDTGRLTRVALVNGKWVPHALVND